MASFDVIKTEVKKRLGNRTDIDDRLNIWINDAYFELLMEPEFTFYELDTLDTIVTVANQRVYDLSTIAGLWFILMIRDETNSREVKKTSVKYLDRIARSIGQPNRYARFADTLELDPTPDDAYTLTIRFRYRPNQLVSGAYPLINREWDEVLVVLATIKGYEALEQPEKASAARNLLYPLLDKRKDQEVLEDEDSEFGLRVRLHNHGYSR